MALNNFIVDAIAGARGLTTSSLIGQISSAPAGNALAVLKQQLDKIKNSEALNDSQRAQKQRLTAAKDETEKKSSVLEALNQQLSQVGNLANQLNGLGGLRAEETKKVKVLKEIKGQKTIETLGNPLDVKEVKLEEDKIKIGDADTLFGGKAKGGEVQELQVQIQVAAGATNVPVGLPAGTVTAQRIGDSNEIRLLDANRNVIDLRKVVVEEDKGKDDKEKEGKGEDKTNTGELKDIAGVSVAKVTTSTVETTTIQETVEQRKQADLKKIRETFSAFNEQIKSLKSFLSENTKQGGALQNDSGARQLQTELDKATQQLSGLDVDKFVQGAEKSFVQFERVGRATAQSVANVASRFGGPGSVLGQEVSGLQSQTKGITSQLENLANIEQENRKQLQAAAADITNAVLAIGNQKAFLQKVGNEPGATTTPRKAASVNLNLPKLPGTNTTTIGVGTAAAA